MLTRNFKRNIFVFIKYFQNLYDNCLRLNYNTFCNEWRSVTYMLSKKSIKTITNKHKQLAIFYVTFSQNVFIFKYDTSSPWKYFETRKKNVRNWWPFFPPSTTFNFYFGMCLRKQKLNVFQIKAINFFFFFFVSIYRRSSIPFYIRLLDTSKCQINCLAH